MAEAEEIESFIKKAKSSLGASGSRFIDYSEFLKLYRADTSSNFEEQAWEAGYHNGREALDYYDWIFEFQGNQLRRIDTAGIAHILSAVDRAKKKAPKRRAGFRAGGRSTYNPSMSYNRPSNYNGNANRATGPNYGNSIRSNGVNYDQKNGYVGGYSNRPEFNRPSISRQPEFNRPSTATSNRPEFNRLSINLPEFNRPASSQQPEFNRSTSSQATKDSYSNNYSNGLQNANSRPWDSGKQTPTQASKGFYSNGQQNGYSNKQYDDDEYYEEKSYVNDEYNATNYQNGTSNDRQSASSQLPPSSTANVPTRSSRDMFGANTKLLLDAIKVNKAETDTTSTSTTCISNGAQRTVIANSTTTTIHLNNLQPNGSTVNSSNVCNVSSMKAPIIPKQTTPIIIPIPAYIPIKPKTTPPFNAVNSVSKPTPQINTINSVLKTTSSFNAVNNLNPVNDVSTPTVKVPTIGFDSRTYEELLEIMSSAIFNMVKDIYEQGKATLLSPDALYKIIKYHKLDSVFSLNRLKCFLFTYLPTSFKLIVVDGESYSIKSNESDAPKDQYQFLCRIPTLKVKQLPLEMNKTYKSKIVNAMLEDNCLHVYLRLNDWNDDCSKLQATLDRYALMIDVLQPLECVFKSDRVLYFDRSTCKFHRCFVIDGHDATTVDVFLCDDAELRQVEVKCLYKMPNRFYKFHDMSFALKPDKSLAPEMTLDKLTMMLQHLQLCVKKNHEINISVTQFEDVKHVSSIYIGTLGKITEI